MIKIFNIILAGLIAMSCLGAKEIYTYSYLMTHPADLEKAYKKCEASLDDTACNPVKLAAEDFIKLVADRRDNPQAFGKEILKSQTLLADLQMQLNHVPKNSPDFLKLSESYNNQLQKVNTLLSVVAETSM